MAVAIKPNKIRECLYLLDTRYQLRGDLSGALAMLGSVYNISEEDASELVAFWIDNHRSANFNRVERRC
jgi:hypothetical protein